MEEEFQKEQLVKNKLMILASFTMVLILLSSIFIVLKKYTIDKANEKNNNENNNTTHSDDNTGKNENDSSSKNKAYIYCSGYQDYAPIAFTYDCKNKECALTTSKENIFLYDNNTLKYREMTIYESNQINATDGTPKGENLNINNFKEISKVMDYIKFNVPNEKNTYGIEVYALNGKNIYVVDKNQKEFKIFIDEIKYEEKDILNTVNKRILFDYETLKRNYIMYFNNEKDNVVYQVYDIKNDKLVYDLTTETIDGENVFYSSFKQIPISFGMDKEFYIIKNINEKLETTIYLGNNFKYISSYKKDDIYYIREDKIYSIKDNQLYIVNNKNEITTLKDKIYLGLYNNNILYIENNYLKVNDIITNEVIMNSEINIEKDSFLSFDILEDKYVITYKDENAKQEETWNNISNIFFEANKTCYQNVEELIPGYKLTINKIGEIISKELFVINNKC